jgi:hypothetical protein
MAAFTTIAAGVGLAATVGGSAMSFSQASKQKKLQREAEADASKAMAEARKKLDVNFYEQLGIQKEPYELEREALLSAGAQAIEAGQESERGAAATAGRVQLAQQQGQRQIAAAMGQEMLGLEKLAAQEESRLRDMNVGLDMEEAAGAQLAAREAARMSAAATTQGIQGIQSAAQQLYQAAPLFQKNLGAQKSALSQMGFSTEEFQKFGNVAEKGGMGPAGTDGFTNLDFQKIGTMSNPEYRQFLKALTPQQQQMLFMNKQYTQLYNPFNPFR